MFTGLIQDIGTVRSVAKDGDWKIVIEAKDLNLAEAAVGASIACRSSSMT